MIIKIFIYFYRYLSNLIYLNVNNKIKTKKSKELMKFLVLVNKLNN